MQIEYYIVLSLALFCIGIVGVLARRNAIIIFMCIELMLNAVNLLLVAFSKMHHAANSAKVRVRLAPPPGLPNLDVHNREGYYAPSQ